MKIEDDVLDVLKRSRIDGAKLFLPEQLDRQTYMKVDKVLKALGGAWNRGQKAHIFQGSDLPTALSEAINAKEVATNQEEGYFPTPRSVAMELFKGPWEYIPDPYSFLRPPTLKVPTPHLSYSNFPPIHDEFRVLEPSVGSGHLLNALSEVVGQMVYDGKRIRVHAYETNPSRYIDTAHTKFKNLDVTVENVDFLEVEPPTQDGLKYHLVLMNPPFAKSQDVKHILHAIKFLRPGGVLLGICSAGVEFRSTSLYSKLQDIIEDIGECWPLPEGSFSPLTEVNTARLYIRG